MTGIGDTASSTANIRIIVADLGRKQHEEAFLSLTAGYMADHMGDGKTWTKGQKRKVIEDLSKHPACLILLATNEEEYVGICTCFYGYSTFLASGLYNIHDIYVRPEYRGSGIGRKLLKEVERIGKKKGAAKLTLEVREDNFTAKNLYQQEGYGDTDPAMLFWSKYI